MKLQKMNLQFFKIKLQKDELKKIKSELYRQY